MASFTFSVSDEEPVLDKEKGEYTPHMSLRLNGSDIADIDFDTRENITPTQYVFAVIRDALLDIGVVFPEMKPGDHIHGEGNVGCDNWEFIPLPKEH